MAPLANGALCLSTPKHNGKCSTGKGTHEGKKDKSKNANTPLQRVKMANFFGKYLGGTKIVANSHWLLDNREICFKYTCNGPISKQSIFI